MINGNLGNAKIWSAYNFKQMFPNNSPSGYGAVIRTFGTSEPHNFIGDSYYIASDQDGKFFTGVQTNGAELITWRDIALKSDFVKYTISGTTDGYGQIQNPKSEYIPIAAASGYFAISSDGNVVRVVNVAQSNIELLKNEEVNFIVIAIKKSALTNI